MGVILLGRHRRSGNVKKEVAMTFLPGHREVFAGTPGNLLN